jgi:hypothetical protein
LDPSLCGESRAQVTGVPASERWLIARRARKTATAIIALNGGISAIVPYLLLNEGVSIARLRSSRASVGC